MLSEVGERSPVKACYAGAVAEVGSFTASTWGNLARCACRNQTGAAGAALADAFLLAGGQQLALATVQWLNAIEQELGCTQPLADALKGTPWLWGSAAPLNRVAAAGLLQCRSM